MHLYILLQVLFVASLMPIQITQFAESLEALGAPELDFFMCLQVREFREFLATLGSTAFKLSFDVSLGM